MDGYWKQQLLWKLKKREHVEWCNLYEDNNKTTTTAGKGGRSVGIVRLRTTATEFNFLVFNSCLMMVS
jgi:hypothetical protein